MKLRPEYLVLSIIFVAALLRFVPHPDNMTPIGALALFSGAYLQRQVLWLVPIGALLLGDAATGFYSPLVMAFVYVGFLSSTAVGRVFLHERDSWARIAAATVAGACVFWTLSNLGNWLAFYPNTLEGLLSCYFQGLPYLMRSVAGDAAYVALLFCGFKLLRQAPLWAATARAS